MWTTCVASAQPVSGGALNLAGGYMGFYIWKSQKPAAKNFGRPGRATCAVESPWVCSKRINYSFEDCVRIFICAPALIKSAQMKKKESGCTYSARHLKVTILLELGLSARFLLQAPAQPAQCPTALGDVQLPLGQLPHRPNVWQWRLAAHIPVQCRCERNYPLK